MRSPATKTILSTSREILYWLFYAALVLGLFYIGTPLAHGWKTYFRWAIHGQPLRGFANFLIVLSILRVSALGFRSRVSHLFVILSTVSLFAFADRLKIQNTGIPLLPSDLRFLIHPTLLLGYLSPLGVEALAAIGGGFLLIFLLRVLRRSDRELANPRPSHPGIGWTFTVPGILLAVGIIAWGPRPLIFNQSQAYLKLGPALATLTNLRSIQGSVDYQESSVLRALKIDGLPNHLRLPLAPEDESSRPDIVVLMIESLFDPLSVPGVKFSRDPLANMRRLSTTHPHGKVVVPVFGGGTANTEFEALTGLSTVPLPQGKTVYEQYVKGPTNSVASLLRAIGYSTTALHNFRRQIYRRDEVYPLLGFDRFYGIEDLVPNWSGSLPSDTVIEEGVKRVLSENTDRAHFIFGVTVAMHGSYDHVPERATNPIRVESPYGEEINREIANYANAEEKTDAMIGRLANLVLVRKRRTALFLFGDHYPALGMRSGFYAKAGMIPESETFWDLPPSERLKVTTTPYLEVANFSPPRKIPSLIGANCLAPEIARLSGWRFKTRFWNSLAEFCEKRPYLQSGQDYSDDPEVADYRVLIFDRLVGNRYSVGLVASALAKTESSGKK